MSNTESFIDEVTEEVRRDQLYRLFRRYGWIGVLVVVLIVGGAAWNEWQKARDRAAAEAKGEAILNALDLPDGPARLDALAAVVTAENNAPVPALILAAEQERTGDLAGARATLEGLAQSPTATLVYRDLAELKALMLADATLPPEERLARLQALAVPGRPFALLAEEQIALAHVAAGDVAAAGEILSRLAEDATASAGLRERVQGLMVALGLGPVQE